MRDQLPALQVLLPLIGAAVCVLLRSRVLAWAVYAAASAGALACAVLLADRVRSDGTLRYAMGGWEPPVGIEFVVADFNTPLLLIVSVMATVVAGYARPSAAAEVDPERAPLFYACLCLLVAGLLGLSVTGDAFNAFVFLEISSLATYALIAMGRNRRGLVASFRYLMVGSIGATFVLLGIGMAYGVTGTLNMADLRMRIAEIEDNRALYAAVVFVFVGLAIKMALFPLHAWLPASYAEAPSAVSTLLAATSTKVAIYLFARFAFTVFGATLVFQTMPLDQVGLVLGCLAMLVGSAIACLQQDLKYILAWSSVGQIGYIVAGISLATQDGVAAGYVHLFNHAMIKGAMFAAAGLILLRLGTTGLPALGGLGRRMPWTFAALVIGGIGLVGVPPSAGFASKWALAQAMVDDDQWVVLAVLLISSLLALVYIGRIIEAAWFREPDPAVPSPTRVVATRSPTLMVAAVWVLVLASVYFGLDPRLTGELADSAAETLFQGGLLEGGFVKGGGG